MTWRRAGAVAACLLLAHCATVPSPQEIAQQREQVRRAYEYGERGYRESRAIIGRVQGQDGRDFLQHHLEIEAAVSGVPLAGGNQVRLLADGPATYAAMQRAITAARRYVRMETYIFDDGQVGQLFADLLIAKSRSGVDVAVAVDAVGSLATPEAVFERMREAGVKVLVFNPVNPMAGSGWAINRRNHRKVLVVDGEIGFVGGINVSDVYTSSPSGSNGSSGSSGSSGSGRAAGGAGEGAAQGGGLPWRDTHVEIRGPAVAQIDAVFEAGWREQQGPPLAQRAHLAVAPSHEPLFVRILANQPGAGDSYAIYLTLMSAIASARKSIWVTMAYFVPDPAFVQALADAAARGVDVVLVLPGFSDSSLVFHAGRSHYTSLLKAGVQIYERRDALLHAKTIVVDGVWSTVGSSNLDWRSFALNHEINAVILGEEFGAQMQALFREDVAASRRIDPRQWERRPISDRLMEAFSRLFERWL